MSLFQTTVLNKYFHTLNTQILEEKWQTYQAHFFDPVIQENIRNSKEEQYQAGFLRDLFVNILGYTLNPDSDFNLTTELKNVKDSKKADGGILVGDRVVGVIELKGTDTTDLSKVEAQAFGYKNNQPDCNYVVISNFEKLRFYIDNAIEHIEFNLFSLTQSEFKLLYLCLAYDNLSKDLPRKIKNESLSKEETITKKLYLDYSAFKRELFDNLINLNPDYDALLLFNKSQKLLDRFLFIFFAEDRGLLPPNFIRYVINNWHKLTELDVDESLYERFKKNFTYLYEGHTNKDRTIFAYNGGLFAPDDVLDNVAIDDDLLHRHTLKLSEYDFNSEVDVNILGHIFENSLNEIEEVQAELSGQSFDNVSSKRKKDGVFYTPKYITKYIVENTVGKLCEGKKAELGINDADYTADKRRQKRTQRALLDKLKAYRSWLLQLSIVDPACGSGAFLNEALGFLIAEHDYIRELEGKLLGDSLPIPNIENTILENNLFGVDINEESVEIAKLSLWLRTAKKDRKLNSLSNNIKCGNSLIDDPQVAGDKAFNWQKAFPQVFQEKDKKAFHITWVTHNSRTSQRMLENKVTKGEVFWLTSDHEIEITKTIVDIVEQDNLHVMAYNICGDHVHMLLVADQDEVPNIIRKLKGKSSQKLKEYLAYPREETFTLWAQKYSANHIVTKSQLQNTIAYIKNNRAKHDLDTNKGLQPLVESQALNQTEEQAFAPAYKGGFDVVIGNPPYVKEYTAKQAFDGLHNHPCYQGKMDLWYFFGWLGLEIVKPEIGLISYIAPNNWITNAGASVFRNIVLDKGKLVEFIDFGDFKVFESAGIQTMIYTMKRTTKNENYSCDYSKLIEKKVDTDDVKSFLSKLPDPKFSFFKTNINKQQYYDGYIEFIDNSIEEVLEKIQNQPNVFYLDKNEVAQGIVPNPDFINNRNISLFSIDEIEEYNIKVGDGVFVVDKNFYENTPEKEKKYLHQLVEPVDVFRYYNNYSELYIIYINKNTYSNDASYLESHLGKFKNVMCERRENKNGRLEYFHLHWPRDENFFSKGAKILSPRKTSSPAFAFTEEEAYCMMAINIIKTEKINLKCFTAILNSNLIKFWLRYKGKMQGDIFQIDKAPLLEIPISKPETQQPFITKADQMLSLNKELQHLVQKFQRTLQREFFDASTRGCNPLSKKLQNWHELTFAEFIKEVHKAAKKHNKEFQTLSLSEKADWEDYFLAEQQKAFALQTQINTTDKEIDALVYELYGLTEEEIAIIEGDSN